MSDEFEPLTEALRRVLARSSAAGIGATCVALIPFPAQAATREADPASTLNQVLIESSRADGYGQKESSISKFTEPLRDTPQSVSAVTHQEIDDRALASMNDALRSVPGISLGAGETSWQGTNLYLRGFTTRNDTFLDGMRDFGYYYRDPFNSESLEVLKGPASMIFGRGSTGGVIEQVSKSPSLQTIHSAKMALGTDATRRGLFDVGGALPSLGATAAFRVNAMVHESDVAERDRVNTTRWGIAPSLALGLGTPTRLTARFFHQQDNILPDYGLPWLAGRPAPVARQNFYGFDSDHLDTLVDIATLRFEHDLGPELWLQSQLRHSRATRSFRTSEAAIPAGTTLSTPPAAVTVTRNEFEGFSTDTFTQVQTDMTATFATGALRHELVAGVELGRESSRPTYITNTGVPTTNLASPLPQAYSFTSSYPRLAVRSRADTLGFYALDTMKMGPHWQVVLGVRWDRFDSQYRSTGFSPTGQAIASTAHDEVTAEPSYRAAILYKPLPRGTIYLSAGNSFNPSAEGIESLISSARALAQANLTLDPEKSRTYELGTKWELLEGTALFTAALFRSEKLNARVPDPNTPGFNALGGDQRVDGLEFEVAGSLTAAWKLRAAYTLLDSSTIRSSPGGPVAGAPLTVTPRHTASVWSDHQLTPRLSVGAGAVSVSSRLGQNTASATLVAPGYTVFDAMARYQLRPSFAVQLNISNLSNKYYFDQLHPFHVVPGPGRTVQLSLDFRF